MSGTVVIEPAATGQTRAEARARLALGVASGAAFLAMLDATVANLAVADLHGDFPGVAVGDLSWVVTIYAIAFAALLAPGGRIADVVGRRALLMAGVGDVHHHVARRGAGAIARRAAGPRGSSRARARRR